MRRLRSRFLAPVLAMLLVAAACGNDDDPFGIPDDPGDDDRAPATDIDDLVDDELAALIERAHNERVRVAYLTTGPDGTEEQFVVSQDPPNQAVIFEGGRIVTTEGRTVFCDGDGPDASCFVMPALEGIEGAGGFAAAFLGPFFAYQGLLATGLGEIGVARTTTIAGRSAACTTIDERRIPGSVTEGEVTMCVDADTGFLLRFEFITDAGIEGIEATEFGEPRPEDFEIPSEPVDLMTPPTPEG